MATFHRIVQSRWAATAMSGEGARLYGGRWNPPGLAAVYLAESRALAALEILVHAPREALLLEWSLISVEVPDGLIEHAEDSMLPVDWRNLPSSPGARRFGETWLRSNRAVAITLPSVILREERALLLNPSHVSVRELRILGIRGFRFDERLVTSAS